jgi:uncharacterized protein
MKTNFILYVASQARSRDFYAKVLCMSPRLDVPGMSEFELASGCILGIMPEEGIKRLLGDTLPDPAHGNGTPRAELYLTVDNPSAYHARALEAGAHELAPLQPRDWGDSAAYSLDPDGHVLAFAEKK